MKRCATIILVCISMIYFAIPAAAKDVFEGYITGNLCGAYSMICPLDHRDGKQEHIVLMTKDGRTVYELQGLDKKQLYNHFTHLVRVEGRVQGNAIEVRKITHIGAGEAGKIIGKKKMGHKGGQPHIHEH